MAKLRHPLSAGGLLLVLALGYTVDATAQATATIVGTVKDEQGAVIAGATVKLLSESRGTAFPGKTTAT